MNEHLKRVREFHESCGLPQADYGVHKHLSDMDIIMRQALLMDAGSETLTAIKSGDMVAILAGLADLAYYALGAIALQGQDVVEEPVLWRHDGFVLSVMRLLSDKINQCASGQVEHYSALYCLCAHLAKSFINADFDKTLLMLHNNNMARLNERRKSRPEKLPKAPDLSDCLYE
jgi:hypothetical protein